MHLNLGESVTAKSFSGPQRLRNSHCSTTRSIRLWPFAARARELDSQCSFLSKPMRCYHSMVISYESSAKDRRLLWRMVCQSFDN